MPNRIYPELSKLSRVQLADLARRTRIPEDKLLKAAQGQIQLSPAELELASKAVTNVGLGEIN